jgi:hypothetical protein
LDFRVLRPFFLYTPFWHFEPVHTVYGTPERFARDQHAFFLQYDRVATELFRRGLRAEALRVCERVTAILVLPQEIDPALLHFPSHSFHREPTDMPTRRNRTQRIRWHPQTEALLLCVHRASCCAAQRTRDDDPWPFALPRLPPELWQMILTHPRYGTTPHPVMGIPAPLLTRATGDPPNLLERWDKGWGPLPASTRHRWSVFGRLGLYLHMMDNRVQIQQCTAHDIRRPRPDWRTLQMVEAGRAAAKTAVLERLRLHNLSPEMADTAADAIVCTIDDSEAWRGTAMVCVEPISAFLKATVVARREIDDADTRAVRSQHRRQTSRRLEGHHPAQQLGKASPLQPPLGLHVREGLNPPMLRYLAAQGLCAPDNQPPATLTTSAAIIKHIFSQP